MLPSVARYRCWAILALALFGVGGGADWERFRGPNGTGVTDEKDVPLQWAGEESLRWKWAIPGTGNSSPIISAGKVFLQSAAPNGSERRLHCLDAASGKELWTRSTPGAKARTHQRNTLASCTPAADGQRVYDLAWDGVNLTLATYDFEGKPQWKRELGRFTGQHGAGHSPIVFDGLVILNNDQDGKANLLAFDARTGKPVWEVPRTAYRACYSTPFVRTNEDGQPEIVVLSSAGAAGYDPRTHAENWHCEWSTSRPLRTVGSPIAADGYLVAQSGDGSGARHFMVVKLGAKGNLTGTNVAWEKRQSFPYVPCPLTRGEYLYTVNDQGIAACHHLRTGQPVWSERLGSPVTASPILVDGKIYVVGEDGHVFVFEAAPTFKLLGKSTVHENVMASPAVADHRLYVRGKNHLFCFGNK